MAGLDYIRTQPANASQSELYTSGTLIAGLAEVVSGWFDFQTLRLDSLVILRTSTTGTYVVEIDWSRGGVTADVTEVIDVTNNTSVAKTVAARYGRVRIKNTHATDAFTVHRTVVTGRSA